MMYERRESRQALSIGDMHLKLRKHTLVYRLTTEF